MSKKLIGIDFEYNRPMEAHMGLMAVSICTETSKPQSMWLYNDSQAKATFASWLTARKDTHIFISHNATAEAGCFLALGLNPRDFSWRDTMVEFTQVGNGYNKYQYGWSWIEHQGWLKSEPLFDSSELDDADHLFGEDREKEVEIRKAKQSAKGVSNLKVTASLLNTCKNVLGIDIGAGQKSEALALILECKAEYSQAEKDQILTYANGDTQHLIPLWLELRSIQHSRTRKPIEQIEQFAEFRGRYSANVAIYARNGIPIDIKRWENLVHNKPIVLAEEIERFQKEVAYIYEYDRKAERYKTSPNQAMAKPWVESLEKKLRVTWPTSSRGYSFSVADGSPLQDFRDVDAEVLQYCRLQELMAGLKAHATELEAIERHKQGKRTFRDAMCSQNFLHPWYKPFGTQTGRNAPAATGFVFAQAGWLRGLVNPPKGQVIIECLAEGTLVLTKARGFTKIETVTLQDQIWDGQEWNNHSGVILKGESYVCENNGLWATKEHKFVSANDRWKMHGEMYPYRRYDIPEEAISWTAIWNMVCTIGMAWARSRREEVRNTFQWLQRKSKASH